MSIKKEVNKIKRIENNIGKKEDRLTRLKEQIEKDKQKIIDTQKDELYKLFINSNYEFEDFCLLILNELEKLKNIENTIEEENLDEI